jgi:uncharacterized membrane protein
MRDLERNDLELLSQHSDISRVELQKTLEEDIYPDQDSWATFIRITLITLGVGFMAAGIIFFFAYNWDDLGKFAKLGIVQGLVVLVTILALVLKIDTIYRNIILTGSSILVGVMFAVFGQVYQTGANAYDFFLAWTAFITLWVLISNFPPLWLLYLFLSNLTIYLYWDQVAKHWDFIYLTAGLFVLNASVVLLSTWINDQKKGNIPLYFINIISIGAVIWGTYCNLYWILDWKPSFAPVIIFATILFYGLGLRHGIRNRSIFYMGLLPFSIVIILSGAILKAMESYDETGIFLVGLFIVSSVSLIIWNLIKVQRRVKHGN